MTEEQRIKATWYLTRTSNRDVLVALGLAADPVRPRRGRKPKLDRSLPGCLCSSNGRAYRLCRHHGDPEALKGLSQRHEQA